MTVPVIELESYLPRSETLSVSEVAIAMVQAMSSKGLAEAKAECPFCTTGSIHAGRIGNFRRFQVECDTCIRGITESFRSAMALQSSHRR